MVSAKTPSIARIKKEASLTETRALLSIAICEVCDFFNVGKNMNDSQIAMTVDLIIEQFWHLKLEEIKYCFHRSMRTEKVYDRLDGNIILSWLQKYDNERTEIAMQLSDSESTCQQNQTSEDSERISFQDYVSRLERRALDNEDAARILEDIKWTNALCRKLETPESRKEKDREFKKWKMLHYLTKHK